jgi:hypothetical protein
MASLLYLQHVNIYNVLLLIVGYVDVSALKKKLVENPKLWDEEHHKQSNVHLIRPAHDNWGIQKIIFHFCDDFMQKIVDFPWSYDPEWQQLLQPIYDSLQLKPHQIIRALFASMPSDCIIPVHHDTGE